MPFAPQISIHVCWPEMNLHAGEMPAPIMASIKNKFRKICLWFHRMEFLITRSPLNEKGGWTNPAIRPSYCSKEYFNDSPP